MQEHSVIGASNNNNMVEEIKIFAVMRKKSLYPLWILA